MSASQYDVGAARRLAWFTPLPPETSGVAAYNVELLPGLATAFEIDVFVDGRPDRFAGLAPGPRVYSAHDFVWKQFRQPYDLVVYQLGNAPCHDYMWAYLVRYPGLVVMHDGQLHHARARALLAQGRADDYRSEFRFNHPGSAANLPELGIAGLLGDQTYLFPMRRLVIESARLVVVHNQWLALEILDEQPTSQVRVVEMGVRAPQVRAGARERIRLRHGIPEDAVVFGSFGRVTPEKRTFQIIRALDSVRETLPNIHLMLCGETVGSTTRWRRRPASASAGTSPQRVGCRKKTWMTISRAQTSCFACGGRHRTKRRPRGCAVWQRVGRP